MSDWRRTAEERPPRYVWIIFARRWPGSHLYQRCAGHFSGKCYRSDRGQNFPPHVVDWWLPIPMLPSGESGV